MKKIIRVLILSLCFMGFSAQAKELQRRLGVGLKDNTSVSIPSVAVAYYPVSEMGLTGGLGIDTQKDNSKFQLHVGLRRILFKEEHMNFFFGGQVGLITNEVNSDKNSGYEINALFGGEFFIPGLDSLGFTFEAGMGVASVKDVRFRTIANDPFKAGIIFYF